MNANNSFKPTPLRGKKAVWEELEEIRELIKADDKDGAIGTFQRLMEQIGGSVSEPEIE